MRQVLAFAVAQIIGGLESASGATIRVPEDYPTIQQAIDNALVGDDVLVGSGKWVDRETRLIQLGDITYTITSCGFLRGGINLRSVSGAQATTVDGGQTGPGLVVTFLLANQTTGEVALEGFTVTGAGTNSAAISASDSDRLLVKSCRVVGNTLGVAGTAVQGNSTELVILDSEVSFNTADQIAGIVMREAGIELRRTRIEGNQGTGLVVGADVPVVVTDCEFIGNRGGRWGGGAYIGTQIPVVVERNLFLGNVATFPLPLGGAIQFGYVGGSVKFNTFAYDSSEASGGGVSVQRAVYPLTISHNTFVGCHAAPGYSGAAFGVGSNSLGFEFNNNIVSHSTGCPAVANHSSNTINGGCNDYWGNSEGDFYLNWGPQATDFFLDPLFCDPKNHDFSVNAISPCAPDVNPECGQVGAWAVGCGSISVTERTWGGIKSLYR